MKRVSEPISGLISRATPSVITRTYGRTYGDELVQTGGSLTKANVRVRRPIHLEERHETALNGLPAGYPGPRRHAPLGFIYAIDFSFGVVKVGQTIAPRGRMRQHITDAIRFNGDVTNWWLSVPHEGWRTNEAALINWCDDNGRQTFGEYFAELAYRDVLHFAQSLPYVNNVIPFDRRAQ